jgi:hypothetical protein
MVWHKFTRHIPRIVSISSRERTLMDYRQNDFGKHAAGVVNDAGSLLSDHEFKLLLVWALIAPSAAVAYLIWIRYKRLRPVAVGLFIVSLFQFYGQWSTVWGMLSQRFFGG